MHFALAFLTTTLTAVLATVVPVARQELDPSKCTCPRIELERGTHINQGVDWYQCAYASGACMWNMVHHFTCRARETLELTGGHGRQAP
jgi:hypothetical protein